MGKCGIVRMCILFRLKDYARRDAVIPFQPMGHDQSVHARSAA